MKILDFIRENLNWEELLTNPPYNLIIKKSNEYVLFKYNQLNSDFTLDICNEARGLILDMSQKFPRIVRYAFSRFYNLGEGLAAKIDWETAVATEKMDGSLITLWYDNDKWHVSTNSNIDAYETPLSGGIYNTFGKLFDAAAQNVGLDYSKLNINHNYTFELCSPFNKVVLSYNEPTLYHISTRDMTTFEELDENIGVPKPARYFLENEEDYQALVASMDDTHEGIVVCDKNFNRVKIKTQTYFTLHMFVNNHVITLKRAVDLVRRNDYKELLVYFPEYTEFFDSVVEKLESARQLNEDIKTIVAAAKLNGTSRKDFAESFKDNHYHNLLMKAWDDKLDSWFNYDPEIKEDINKMHLKQIIEYYGLED